MQGLDATGSPAPLIGIAGRPSTAEEKSYVKQAVFLLRFRIHFDEGLAARAASALPE